MTLFSTTQMVSSLLLFLTLISSNTIHNSKNRAAVSASESSGDSNVCGSGEPGSCASNNINADASNNEVVTRAVTDHESEGIFRVSGNEVVTSVAVDATWDDYGDEEEYEVDDFFSGDDDSEDDEYNDSDDEYNDSDDEYNDSDDEYNDSDDEEEEECTDTHDLCFDWSEVDECDKNPSYMLEGCKKSCGICRGDREDADCEDMTTGETQSEQDDNTTRVMNRSYSYKCHEILDNPAFFSVEDECVNEHSMCSFWVTEGECEKNPNFMLTACALACRSCLFMDSIRRCPIDRDTDAFRPGDLNRMFRRITDTSEGSEYAQYEPTVLSCPEGTFAEACDQVGPWVVTFDNFLSDEECDRLVELGQMNGYERSANAGKAIPGGGVEKLIDETRTSYNTWCKKTCDEDPMTVQATERISKITGTPKVNQAFLQLLKYDVGQFYGDHHDYIPVQNKKSVGPRALTLLLYLNDVEEGGGTSFSMLNNMTVSPKKGKALLWPSVLDQNPSSIDERTRHEALPVLAGVKYAANAWIHLRDYKDAYSKTCN